MATDLTTIGWLLPELLLVATATLTFVGGAFLGARGKWGRGNWAAACAIMMAVAAVLAFNQQTTLEQETRLAGPLVLDTLAGVGRGMAAIVGLLFVAILGTKAERELAPETLGMVVLSTAGLMLVCSAGDLVLLFLGLELISIPTYAILFIGRRNRGSAESAIKYFLLSVMSSALMLYGLTLVYGVTGTLQWSAWPAALADEAAQGRLGILPLAAILIYAGLGFKIAAVPFHFYAPDVYQATTNGNAGFLSIWPKVAGIIAMVRVVGAMVPAASPIAWQLAVVLSVITMTLGNVCALWQKNLRRMMAYSSIAHAGYMLIGLAVGFSAAGREEVPVYDGTSAALLYLLVYAFATLGTFAVLAHLSSAESEANDLDELAGLGRRRPLVAGMLAIFMFSLTGIPPTAGFWGKMVLFSGALNAAEYGGRWFLALAIVGALNAATAAGYYLRVIGSLYFRDGALSDTAPRWTTSAGAAAVCAVVVLIIGLMPGPVVRTFGTIGTSGSRQAVAVHPAGAEQGGRPPLVAATSPPLTPQQLSDSSMSANGSPPRR